MANLFIKYDSLSTEELQYLLLYSSKMLVSFANYFEQIGIYLDKEHYQNIPDEILTITQLNAKIRLILTDRELAQGKSSVSNATRLLDMNLKDDSWNYTYLIDKKKLDELVSDQMEGNYMIKRLLSWKKNIYSKNTTPVDIIKAIVNGLSERWSHLENKNIWIILRHIDIKINKIKNKINVAMLSAFYDYTMTDKWSEDIQYLELCKIALREFMYQNKNYGD